MSEQKTYTVSAKQDHIREFFNHSKEYRKKLQLLKGNRGGVFLFNPMEDEVIENFFLEDPEEFHFVVKTAIFLYLQAETPDSGLAEYVKNNTTIKYTDATKIKLGQLNASYEGTPVIFDAQILGIGEMQSYTKKAVVSCPNCGHEEKTTNLSKKIHCSNKETCSPMNILEVKKSSIITGDIMSVMIQEPMEESDLSIPITRHCIVKDEDVYLTKPGQRKRIIGVFRSVPIINKSMNRVEINCITLDDLADIPEPDTTEEEKLFYHKLLKQGNFQNLISESLAPEIIYETLAKFIIIICAIGGYNKAGLKTLCHALLIGDPGSGKTQILEAALKLLKKTGFLNGASMTGSTATITMDQLPNKQKFPKAGIIPMCDGGLAAIDELNVLYERTPEDVTRIYQGMVSQYIDYNKGGFNQRLKARTTIIAGANPRFGFYDSSKGPVDNINLPAPLISRFDFKVNMERKKKSAEEKSAIRKHMTLVREIGLDQYSKDNNLLSEKQLMRFINYAQSFKPAMTPEADEALEKFCAEMEEVEQPLGSIPLDNRFFESMLIISTAVARFYLSNKITTQ
ncbi:MAG: hypothetical protein O6761_07885, partial [Thaumarchaeota archaeon]|nr:hypothetical protein [Nitrososphaerota archaeon]